ncbi:MAG: phosphotransferase [Pseudomonas marincola]
MDALITAFLEKNNWGSSSRTKLAGDASSRQYERLTRFDGTAILMIDPDTEVVQKFLSVTDILQTAGYSAPTVLAFDLASGLVLLEDFGNDLFAWLLTEGADEEALYELATDFLIDLSNQTRPTGLPYFSSNYVLDQNTMFLDWYVPKATDKTLPDNARFFFQQIWRQLLKNLEDDKEVLLLRDFHAENLLYLSDRDGLKALGLLDYQDAMTGPAAYDLVSLLQDARRDVSPEIAGKMLDRYIAKSGVDETEFRRMYAILGAHRALRIMGIFTRLADRDNKPRYLEFMPRMIAHFQTNLTHPDLLALKHWITVSIGKLG